jgi:hypothetical protein
VAGYSPGVLPRYRQAGGTGRKRPRSAAPARMAGPSSGRRVVSHREITIKGALILPGKISAPMRTGKLKAGRNAFQLWWVYVLVCELWSAN